MKRIPLRWKISLLPAALMLGLLVAVLWLGERILEERLWADAEARAEQSANLLARRLARTLDRRVEELRLVAGLPELRESATGEGMRAALERALRYSPYFVWLGLRNERGVPLLNTGDPPSQPVNGDAPVGAVPRFGSVVFDPAFSAAQGQGEEQRYLDIAVAAIGPDRDVIEVAGRIAWRNLEQLRDDQRDDDADDGVIRLVLVARDELLMASDLAPPWRQALLQAHREAGPNTRTRHVVEHGGETLMMVPATAAVSAGGQVLPWRIYAVQDAASIVAPAEQWNRAVMWVGLLAAALIGAAGYLLALRLQTPYRPFLEAIAKRVREQPAEAGKALTQHLDAITQELGASPEVTSLPSPATGVLDQLVEAAQRLRAVLEQIPAGVLLIDPNGLLVFSNRAADDLLHLGVARRAQPFVLGFSDPQTRARLEQLLSGNPDGDDGRSTALLLDDGSTRWCHLRSASLTDSGGGRQGTLLVVQDVGREVLAQRRVRALATNLRLLVDAASDYSFLQLDARHCIALESASARAGRMDGYRPDELIGVPFASFFEPGPRAAGEPERLLEQAQADGRAEYVGWRVRRDGSRYQAQVSIYPLPDGNGFALIVRDVTERVRTEQALLRYRDELQSLAQQLLTQEKLTTARLAQALHDQLGQTLAALSLCLDAALPAGGDESASRPALRARELASQAIREVRGVLIGLRPPLLDEHGLVAALDNEVALQSDRHAEVDILVEHDADPPHRWPGEVEYAAFMITREALANALLHAGASVVRITLQSSERGLSVEVEDDGRGLPGGGVEVRPGHFGVLGMRERAAAVGARFEMGSKHDAGVIVRFDWQVTE